MTFIASNTTSIFKVTKLDDYLISLLFLKLFVTFETRLVNSKAKRELSGEMRKLVCLQRNLSSTNKPVKCYFIVEKNQLLPPHEI